MNSAFGKLKSAMVLPIALLAIAIAAGACGSTRGAVCSTDKDCDSDQECISPGCATSTKRCAYTCASDSDCRSKTGSNDRCVKPNANCVAYCTPS